MPRAPSSSMTFGMCLSPRLPERISSPTMMRPIAGVMSAMLSPSGQTFESEPLLRPEAPAVVAALLHLVAHTRRVVAVLEVRGAEQDVPPGQQHPEVVASQ